MNTNMFIQDTISEFNDIGYSIDDIFFESAMEADNIIDDDTNKENFAKKLLVTVEKLINEIFAIIDRFISNVKNIFTRIAQTDTGFRDHCRRAMVKNKPLEAIKLITYDYNDNYLEDQMNKMTRECISILTSLKTEYQKERERSFLLPTGSRDGRSFLRLRGFYDDRNHYWTGNHAGRCLLHLLLLPRSWHS